MHPYATDSQERLRVIAILVVLSIVMGEATESFFSLPGWTGFLVDFSAVGWFAFLYWLIDCHLWKWKLFRLFRLFQIPHLGGCWDGELRSSYDAMNSAMSCQLSIKQTWTKISVQFQTERMAQRSSRSVSQAASLLLDQDGSTILRYEYHNEPDTARKEELDIHWGTAKIVVVQIGGITELQGSYYTNRTPQTYGSYTLHKAL